MKSLKFIFYLFLLTIMSGVFVSCFNNLEEPDDLLKFGQVRANLQGDSIVISKYDNIEKDTFVIEKKSTYSDFLLRSKPGFIYNIIQIRFAVPENDILFSGDYNPDTDCDFSYDAINNEICSNLIFSWIFLGSPVRLYSSKFEGSESFIEIKEIDFRHGGFVKGIFEGTLMSEDSISMTINNGEFFLPIK